MQEGEDRTVSADVASGAGASAPAVAQDANATRSLHFRALVRAPKTLALAGSATALAALIGVALAGPGVGAAAGAGALLLASLVVWIVADSRAEADFFEAFAAERSLATGGGQGDLPPATALLRQGVRSYTQRTFAGRLPGGLDGLLALYIYETETRDSKGNTHTQYHHFTVVLAPVPGAEDFLRQLACQRRSGFRFLDSAEDAFRSRERIEVESEALDRRCEIFIGKDDDQNRARQLLSPSFVDWLATREDEFAFELEDGMLVCNVQGHPDSAAGLDRLCESAAQVAERISTEVRESAGAESEPASTAFDPRSFVVAADGKGSARLKHRLWALVFVLAIPTGLAIGFLTTGDEDGGGSQPFEERTPDYGSAELAALDDRLLGLVPAGDKGAAVHTDELYGHGVSPGLVDAWISDAFLRGLIELDPNALGFTLTPKGEKLVDRA